MSPFAIAFLLIVAIILPVLAIESARRMRGRPLPIPRRAFFVQTIAIQLILFAAAVLAAWRSGIDLLSLPSNAAAWLAAAAMLVIALAALKIRWPERTPESKQRLYELLPHNRGEFQIYVILCFVAGIAEETIYRGAAFGVLMLLLRNTIAATLVTSVVFAAGHAVQGFRSAVVIFVFALAFQAIVILGGSLLPAIVVHFTYDLIAGIVVPRWYESGLT
jgi:membrane protease YdiL (CAAX protease family)